MSSAVQPPVGLYEKALPAELSWDERLAAAAQAGFDYLELCIDESDARLECLAWSAATRSSVRQAAACAGLPILSMGVSAHRKYPLGSASSELRRRGLDIFYRAIQLAGDLGVRLIQVMGYDVFYEPSDASTVARFLEGLCRGARWATAAGVMLALENVDAERVNSVEKALRFVCEIDSPWFQLYPDAGNLLAAGFDPVSQLSQAQGHLVGVHVKDARPGEVRGVPFGAGQMDFGTVFSHLAGLGYCGPLTVEMWAHLDTSGDPIGAAGAAGRLIRRHVDEAWGNARSDDRAGALDGQAG